MYDYVCVNFVYDCVFNLCMIVCVHFVYDCVFILCMIVCAFILCMIVCVSSSPGIT